VGSLAVAWPLTLAAVTVLIGTLPRKTNRQDRHWVLTVDPMMFVPASLPAAIL
jgi:hypothetical protein